MNLTDKKWRSSNGGDIFDGGGGRAGLKRTPYQGGIQCPLIVRWPGNVPAASESSLLSAHYDFMATMAELIGADLPDGKDSISYLPTLLAKPQTESHDYIIINNRFSKMGRTALVAKDGFKLVEVDRKKDHFQLYNILEDNEERYNLELEHPERFEVLKVALLKELDSVRPDL